MTRNNGTDNHVDGEKGFQRESLLIGKEGEDDEEEKYTRWFAYKNLLIIASSFCLLFTAYLSLQNLQSSIHTDPKIGFISLCVAYVFFMLGSLFLPPLVMKKVGYKYALMISILVYLAFTAAHFYARIWVMIIGAVFVGRSICLIQHNCGNSVGT